MKIFKYILFLAVAFISVSCNTDDYLTYGDDARIQFGPDVKYLYATSYQLSDTLKSYTFVYENASVQQDTVFFDVYTMGRVSAVDRPISLKQVQIDGADNCVAGVHYKAFNDPTVSKHYVIKAGSTHTIIPIVFLRDPSLKNKIYSLRIELEANDAFSLGETSKLWRRINVADRLVRPNSWTTSIEKYYLGTYSYVKHSWMVSQTGFKWDEEYLSAVIASYAEILYWKARFRELLSKYNSNPANPGVPLTDENGILVAF